MGKVMRTETRGIETERTGRIPEKCFTGET